MGNQNLTLLSEASRTTSGQGSALDVSQMSEIAVFLVVTAVSGTTPSLTGTVQDSPDGDNWADAFSFSAVTSAPAVLRCGWQDLKLSTGRFMRLKWTISGSSPNFTFAARLCPVSSN